MKKLIYIFAAAALAFSCNNENAGKGGGEADGTLKLAGTVEDMSAGYVTRASTKEFFGDGYVIDVSLKTNRNSTTQDFKYEYDKEYEVFYGDPPFHFTLDDSYITYLKAIWPTQEVRERGLVTDQREFEDFRLADWLTAEATSLNIMPTSAAVPLNFVRDNVMLEFEIAGQNAEGVDIKELIIEIEVKGKPTAFWAYCGNENGHAYILLDGTTKLSSDEAYLIGRMKVTDDHEYTIIFPAVDIQLEAGKKYLVTLTAQGYDVDAYVYLVSFAIDENSGIGIPFAAPEPDDNGDFIITQPEQLVTMSFLIRHYQIYPGTFDWVDRDYIIADGFELTQQFADLYVPLSPTEFTGRVMRDGVQIYSIEYGEGEVLELYEQ